jgi:hypothetical protein
VRSATISTQGGRRSLVLSDVLRHVSVSALVVTGLVVLAIFLRAYQLEPYAYVPDQYDRLADARLMLSGKLPESQIYPPGAALVLVLPIAIFSASLMTIQAVTAAFGIALVPLAYLGVARLTGDRRAAVLLAGFCALSPLLILYSRAGYFDVVVTFLVALAVFLVPALRGRSLLAFVGYGLLLALLVNFRPSNAVLLPGLALYWLALSGAGLRPTSILRELLSAPLLTFAATFAAVCAISVVAGQWFGGGYSGLVSFERFLPNLLGYLAYMASDWLGLLVVPPAVYGALTLWRTNRPLFGAVAWILCAWPLAHAPFLFEDGRYMAPPLFFTMLLAALGFSALLRPAGAARSLAPKVVTVYAAMSLALLALMFGINAALVPSGWHDNATESDAGLAGEMRPVVERLGSDAVLVSSVTRALADVKPQPEFFDLFDRSLAYQDRLEGATVNAQAMREALDAGRDVYYLYSHMEADDTRIGGVFDGHDVYFDVVSREFSLTEVYRTEALRNGRTPWVLYRVAE